MILEQWHLKAEYETKWLVKADVYCNLTSNMCVSKFAMFVIRSFNKQKVVWIMHWVWFVAFVSGLMSLAWKHTQHWLSVFPVSTVSVTSGPRDSVSPGEYSHYCCVVWQLNMETLFALVKYFLVCLFFFLPRTLIGSTKSSKTQWLSQKWKFIVPLSPPDS